MVARVKLDKTGLIIAQAGHAWSDAEQFLNFSSNSVAMQIYMSGTVGIGDPYDTTSAQGVPYNWNNYRRATIPFGKTFAAPPICFFQSFLDSVSRPGRLMPTRGIIGVGIGSGDWSRWQPIQYMEVTTTALYIISLLANPGAFHEYIILENTIS